MHKILIKKYCFINSFEPNLIKCQDKNTSIIFRNYNENNILNEISKTKAFCRKNNYKLLLANNIQLAMRLGLDGAYIPSFNNNFKHLSYSFKKGFILIGSAHNFSEIKIKEKQKVQKIFLSSIFKKNKNYLGINKFKIYSRNFKNKIIALGGISNKNLNKVKLLNVYGIAGISFFKKKAP